MQYHNRPSSITSYCTLNQLNNKFIKYETSKKWLKSRETSRLYPIEIHGRRIFTDESVLLAEPHHTPADDITIREIALSSNEKKVVYTETQHRENYWYIGTLLIKAIHTRIIAMERIIAMIIASSFLKANFTRSESKRGKKMTDKKKNNFTKWGSSAISTVQYRVVLHGPRGRIARWYSCTRI